ncbi:MAG: outer membrane protein assembly factor BamB [Pseudomonadota bacterium]
MSALIRLLSVLTLAVCLAACGLFGGDEAEEDSPLELIDFEVSLEVDELWSTSAGDGIDRRSPNLQPFYTNGQIWVADHKGRVFAIDAASGERRTEFDLDMDLSAGPAVYGDRLILGTFEGQLLMVDARSGTIEWRAQLSSEILAEPVLADGMVIVRCIDGRVFGIDADSGSRQWVYDRSIPLLTLRGNGAPLARGGQVFLGYDDGSVVALQVTDGTLLWEARVSVGEGRSQLDRLADIDGSLAVVGRDLYAVTRHGRMASLALDSGRIQWVKDVTSHSGLSISRTQLGATDIDDSVWIVDLQSGDTIWRNEDLLRRELTQPVPMGDQWVVADGDGYLHWLDAETGRFSARTQASSKRPAGPPLVIGNTLYLLDRDGRLSAWQTSRIN